MAGLWSLARKRVSVRAARDVDGMARTTDAPLPSFQAVFKSHPTSFKVILLISRFCINKLLLFPEDDDGGGQKEREEDAT